MKKEFLEGYRSFIYFLISCVFFGLFVWRGEGIQAFPYWLGIGAIFMGKNYLQSKVKASQNVENPHLKVPRDDVPK